MFRYHPNSHFIQLYKKLADTIESGNQFCLKTEDGIDIRKLFIKILNSSLKINKLNDIFQTFGEIEGMKVNFGPGKMRMKNRGFVTYKRCCDATKAILSRKKFHGYFILNAADTWLQPDYLGDPQNVTVNSEIENIESPILSVLNDDSLLHVMSFLEPTDVFMLKKVCSKFSDLADYHFRTLKVLNFTVTGSKRMTLLEAKLICEKVGKNVKKLTIDSEKFNNQRILSFIPKYFLDLKYLKLIGFRLDSKEFWYQMKRILLNLESLNLRDNSLINENFVDCFKNAKNVHLKSLDVSNSNLTGDFLQNVQFVCHLNISGCRNIKGNRLVPYFNVNKNLMSLNIANCPNIYGRAVNEMLINAQQLTSLKLNNFYVDEDTANSVIPNINSLINLQELFIHNLNYPLNDQFLRTINPNNCIEVLDISYGNLTVTTIHAISTMKKLRMLIMNFKSSISDDFVDCLVDINNLEELHIAGCTNISTESVLRLFTIKSLRFLDISCCYGFTNDFIFQAVSVIKDNMPRQRLIINVGLTEIDEDISENEDFKKYIHLSWTAAKNMEHDYDVDDEKECMQYNLDDIINILSNSIS